MTVLPRGFPTAGVLTCALSAALAAGWPVQSPEAAAAAGGAARGAGTVVRTEPLAPDLRLAGSGRSLKLWYRSTSWNGTGSVVSGTLDLPPGRPPRGGWPVVSYAHGMTGVADACAPSMSGHWPTEKATVEALLADGYAIVATDFEGLGTPGDHFPAAGRSAAYDMVDIVRAAGRIAPLSRSWVAVGYSMGGHAALFTGALAGRYAPGLDHRGTVAMAPVSQWRVQMSSPANRLPEAAVSFPGLYWATSAAERFPGRFVPERIFTPRGLELLDQARTLCVPDFIAAVGGVTNGDVFQDPGAAADLFADLLAADEVPVVRYPRPVRIAQGLADPLAPLTEITAGQLAQAGNDIVYLPVEGADHTTLAAAVTPRLRTWVRELSAGLTTVPAG